MKNCHTKSFDTSSNSKGRKFILIPLALLVLAFLIVGISAALDPYDCKIADNVTVGGLDVSGMTLLQTHNTLSNMSDTVLEGTVLTLELPGETISLSPADTKVSLKAWPAALAAYRVGRIGNNSTSIGLGSYLKLDEDYIRSILSAYAEKHNTNSAASCYTLTGTLPDLSTETPHTGAHPQTLELTLGLPTAKLDQEDSFQRIMAVYDSAFSAAAQGHYSLQDFKVDILEEPEEPDLDAIYEACYTAPVDDSLSMETYELLPGSYGCRFDPEEAENLIRNAQYGETVCIPMEFIEPEILGDEVYFRDVLGYCETPHTKDENRNHNLRTACASMNDVILQPGEVFSYNETLGERSKENGYLPAPAYAGWELVQSYGGGICQGSSTIYCAVLYADLEVVHRVNHGMRVGYMDAGLDATVSWWGPDFKFRNNTNFPIKIAAEVSDGYVKVTILGTEERDYYIEMETEQSWGSTVLYTKSYKCKYSRETGELISRELEARSNYAL